MSAAVTATSTWSPLRHRFFRMLWIASVASNVGTWMQNIGATWLMTSLNPSPFWVSMVQAASYLPVFLLSLPAGAMADLLDRRKLLIFMQLWMLGAAAVLGVTTQFHVTDVTILLLLTFLMGVGSAVNSPAWQAIIPELVMPEEIAPAVVLGSASFNVARAVGPALGGLVLSGFGASACFYLNAASFLAVVFVLLRWRQAPSPAVGPPEDLRGAVISGFRYVLYSVNLHKIFIRCAVFTLPASALWALLPVVTRDELHGDASTYGVLLGCLGAGAVMGTFVLGWARRALSFDQLSLITAFFFALGTLASAWSHSAWLIGFTLILAGVGWLATLSPFIGLVQRVAPAWVRARALATYLLLFYATLTVGSAVFGAIASGLSTQVSLVIAGACLVLGMILIRWMPLDGLTRIKAQDPHPDRSEPAAAQSIDPREGPVLVTVEYRVAPERGRDFVAAARALRPLRMRDGAYRWNLFHDAAIPGRYLETFWVSSWGEHLRQHQRTLLADDDVKNPVRAFHDPTVEIEVTHWIDQAGRGQEPSYIQLLTSGH